LSTPPAALKPQTYNIRPMRDLPEEKRQEIAQQTLERYLKGEEIRAISEDFGWSHYTVYSLLFQLCEDAWRDAQVSRAMARHADALAELDGIKTKINDATNVLEVAKQRELLKVAEVRLKSAQWELERLLRRLYGDSVPQPGGQGVIHINIGISREPTTYEGEVTEG
jgi:hypothetical protein